MFATELEPTARRLYRLMVVTAAAGVAGALALGGWRTAVGFAAGAVFSAVNLWLVHRLVRKVGATGEEDPGGPQKASIAVFAFRYAAFGLAAYAIVIYFEASLLAVFAGFFVAVAAAILDILCELLYGTRT